MKNNHKTKPQARRKRRAFFVPGFRQREMGRFLSQAFSPRRQETLIMSQKSANMARRLFADQTGQSAAGGRDGRWVMRILFGTILSLLMRR